MGASQRIVHFEIPAERPETLVSFYTDLLGWHIQKAPIPGYDYWMCRTGEGPGIDGAITRKLNPQQGVTNYINVEDIDAIAAKAQALGAKVVVPRSAVPGAGWFCLLLDPEGNPLGFWHGDKSAK